MNVFRSAVFAFRHNVLLILISEAMFAVGSLVSSNGIIGAKIVLTCYLTYLMHRTLLYPDEPKGPFARNKEAWPGGSFWVVFLGFGALAILVILGVAYFVRDLFPQESDRPFMVAVIQTLPFSGLLLAIIFAFAGTALPAAVVEKSLSLKMALRRSRKTFFSVVLWLILGVGLYRGVLIFAFIRFNGWTGIEDFGPGNVGIIPMVYTLVSETLAWFGTALVVAVLCVAYLRTEKADAPSMA